MKDIIPFADLEKIELRVGTVLEAEAVKDSHKLIRLLVDLGGEKRQIIAGIRKSYQASDLAGKQIVVVANLEPRTLAGLESQGMVLAAHDAEGLPIVLMPEKQVPNGSSVN